MQKQESHYQTAEGNYATDDDWNIHNDSMILAIERSVKGNYLAKLGVGRV
ncbi:MAG: hypothetical protein Q7T57_07405 [Dehalococcoidales bacterium]|nr:hypothetical protein [Dehalococcoidales bacterium]